MKSIVTLLLFAALSFLARADTESSPVSTDLQEFAQAFGLPEDTSIAVLKLHLEKSWIGATRDEMRVSLYTIIQARGDMSAVFSYGRECGTSLALSSATRSLIVNATCDESGRIESVTCSIRAREKMEPN